MTNQSKNPIFISLTVLLLGIGLGVWGWIKGDCNSSVDCYAGSGFLKWAGGILIAAGMIGFFVFGNRRRS